MAKVVSATGEQTKHKVRSIRQDGMKQLKHDSKHQSADEIKKLEKSVSFISCIINVFINSILPLFTGTKYDRQIQQNY